MSHEEFKPDDIFINRVKAHHNLNFFIYDSEVTINNHQNLSASNDYALNVPLGFLSLYELNINRSTDLAYPYIINGGQSARHTFRQKIGNAVIGKRPDDGLCNDPYMNVDFGAPQSGSYPMSASIVRRLTTAGDSLTTYVYDPDQTPSCVSTTVQCGYYDSSNNLITPVNSYVSALQNVAKKYTTLSPHFQFSGSLKKNEQECGADCSDEISTEWGQNPNNGVQALSRNLITSTVNMIDIPTIFYGSSIKKGSVTLKYYVTGTLVGECSDTKRNGELIEVSGSKTGSVVGVVMYDEGLMLLTASHSLGDNSNIQYNQGTGTANQWIYFGIGANDGISTSDSDHITSASFDISCRGTSYVNSMTLFCHASKNKLDYSNNPTFVDLSASGDLPYSFSTSSYSYSEEPLPLKNIVSSSFSAYSSSYEKTTYLSKIGIYDEHGNLIMIASMAKPVKKTIQDEYTFKLTLDI